MAINRRTPINDIQNQVKVFPGPYVGYVKSATDVNRMGRLAVFIPMLHGTYDEVNKDLESQTVTVSYCSPFGGQTPLSETTTGNREFANTQKSYGFWMVPPDIDTKVLVMFANGDINNGFWMGCVYEDYMNHMTPGIAVSKPDKFVGTSQEIDEYYLERELSQVPVTEAQRKAETQNIRRYNTDAQNDKAYSVRPAHTPSTQTLIRQGLIKDEVRGTTTASARRETPSQVFGISTPGPIDFAGQQTPPRESINRHGKILSGDAIAKVSHSRLGGHQFVMDDGTPAKNVNNKITEPIKDELIRLRTRSGAQLLLHNTEGLVYITNNDGTAWIEFTKDGKIDIYAQDSVSIHTENDLNFRADRDINLEANRNINIKAVGGTSGSTVKGRVHIDADDNIEMRATDDIKLQAGTDFKLYAGSNGKIEVGTNIDFYAGTDFLVNTGNEIHMNTPGKVSAGHVGNTNVSNLRTFDNKGLSFVSPDDISKSIMKRIPTVEPYNEHENKRYDNTTVDMTDREKIDERKIQ
jgi:hypothetical protein